MKKTKEQLEYELQRANRWAIEAQRQRDAVLAALDTLLDESPLINRLRDRILELESTNAYL